MILVPTDASGKNDSALANLEARWLKAVSHLAMEQNDADREWIQGRVSALETEIAVTQAHTLVGVSVKLNVVLYYEENEEEKRHWLAILQSLKADLEC